mmetsp:Transcript_3610/g.8504  ORF Transcript_3610/g.8504 Transcript_3610/m.8504 type:complete len:90 (+) Transcript_3610:120-389(+)
MSWHCTSIVLLLFLPLMVWAGVSQGLGLEDNLDAPPYFGEPLWQDFRHLLSFALGVICVHTLDSWQSRRYNDGEAYESVEKFELHPFIL